MTTSWVDRRQANRTGFTVEGLYVFVITSVAVVGMASGSHRLLLVIAALLAVPSGLVAIVGLYVLTGLFNWMAAGFSTTTITQSGGGCDESGHCWSHSTGTPVGAQGFLFSAYVVLLFTGAALANVLMLRVIVRSRSRPSLPLPSDAAHRRQW